MNIYKALLLFVCFLSFPVQAQESVTNTDSSQIISKQGDSASILDDMSNVNDVMYQVLSLTYSNNPTISASRSELAATKEQLTQAQSGFKPNVSADADVTFTDTKTEGNSFIVSDGGNTSKNAALNLNQPLYRGGSTIANVRQAQYIIAAQQFKLSETEQDVLYQAVLAYMDLLQNQAVLKLQINNKKLLARELEYARARFKVGELTRTDVSQSEARLAEAQAGIINANAAVKTSIATFIQVVGNPPPANMGYPSIKFEMPNNLEEALTLSSTNNRQIIQARLNRTSADARADSIRGELLPQVSAVGRLNKSYTPSDFVDEQRQASVGLSASIPLYTGGATRSRIREAEKNKVQLNEVIKATENAVRQKVISNWEQWDAAVAASKARKSQVEAAVIALEGVQYETEFGERTTLDSLNANQELLAAQVELVKSKRNEIVARFAIANSLGLMVPQNLGFSTINP